MPPTIITLDVRADLRAGREPFPRIMEAVGRLRVVAPFEPHPLKALYLTQEGPVYVHRDDFQPSSCSNHAGAPYGMRIHAIPLAPMPLPAMQITLWNRRITHVLSVPNPTLQRTAPAVTLAASGLRLSPATQPARQPPQSLSLGSLGVSSRIL